MNLSLRGAGRRRGNLPIERGRLLRCARNDNLPLSLRFARNDNRGFTLLEVMIAIAVLAVSLLAVSNFQGNSLRASARAEKMSTAVLLARQKMNEKILEVEQGIETGEFPDSKEEEGDFGEGYPDFRWTVSLKKMEAPPIPQVPTAGEEGDAVTEQVLSVISDRLGEMMRVLKVTIFWKELEEEEGFSVTTHLANIKTGAGSFTVPTGVASGSGTGGTTGTGSGTAGGTKQGGTGN